MADSNTRRAKVRQVVVYLTPEESALLDAVSAAHGESKSTIIRQALRPHLRKLAREHNIEIVTGQAAKGNSL